MFFSFSKPKEAKLNYRVYLSRVLKYQQLLSSLDRSGKPTLILYFFDQTRAELEALLQAAQLSSCELISGYQFTPEANLPILAELHPLQSVMKNLLGKLNSSDTLDCYVGMDEPLLRAFGSAKTIELMEKLGMDPTESLSHTIIDRAIANALGKLEGKIKQPIDCRTSAEEWARLNGVN